MKRFLFILLPTALSLLPLLSSCASGGGRAALVMGDTDFALFKNRSSESSTKALEATTTGSASSSTAAPEGGGSLQVDPGQLAKLLAAPAPSPSSGGTRSVASAPAPARPLAAAPAHVYYTVQRGDTLYAIARQYRTTAADLRARNGLRGDLIRPGQRLEVR